MQNVERFEELISEQNRYNLLYREEEREMIKFCNETNVAVIPVSKYRLLLPLRRLVVACSNNCLSVGSSRRRTTCAPIASSRNNYAF